MKKIFTTFALLLLGLAGIAQTGTLMPIPAQTGTFTGNVRGYWFTAPTCFTITGVEMPTDAGTGNQSIAILRLDAAPPLYSTTTNAFTTLFLTQNDPTQGPFAVNIQVEQGDVIGVLGQRATVNSYAPAGYTSNINGMTMTLARLGMQYSLTTTPPQNIWTESGSSISRVFLYYDSTLTFNVNINLVSGLTYTYDNGADTSFTSVWDYGDGSPLDTTDTPMHTYASQGNFNVCSYIYTSCGIDTVCNVLNLCSVIPQADYSVTSSGYTTSFSDSSVNASSYMWDFGDGSTDTTASPSHTYATGGWYVACLTTTSSCGAMDTQCDSVLACVAPQAGFSWTKSTADTVMFTNNSSDEWSVWWDFGDGNNSTSDSPSHGYAASGAYQVCLVAMTPCGNDTLCQTVNICLDPVVSNFGQSLSGTTLTLTDSSSGGTSMVWDFGDGNTSTSTNPTHTYTTNGTFTPCLTVWNDCGDSAVSCGNSVTICIAPTASFTWSAQTGFVTFTQTSTLGTSSAWDFGDGSTSTQTDPTHVYTVAGTYNVCLIASSSCGSDTVCDSVNVILLDIPGNLSGTQTNWMPNPFLDQAVMLVSGDDAPATYTLVLIDLQGKIVRTLNGKKDQKLQIERNGLPGGYYIYRLEAQGEIFGTGKVLAR
ncbi:MAG: PKD domain-containing protein [Bacteroidia bacterium]|nr:PKD domain-containing protein [Bacteroidia bacterium]